MGRTALRRATVVLTAALVLTVTFSPVAHAADAGLTAAMLGTGDLPAGFMPDASLTGPLTGQRAQELGLRPSQTGPQDTWVRTWLGADGSDQDEEPGDETPAQPLHDVYRQPAAIAASSTRPASIRYQANGVKSCVAM